MVRFKSLIVGSDNSQDLCKMFGIKEFPTMTYFTSEGKGYRYKEEIAVKSSEGAAFMLWENFNQLELKDTATQKSIRSHDLVSLDLTARPVPTAGNIGMDEFVSFVKRYLDIVASSV